MDRETIVASIFALRESLNREITSMSSKVRKILNDYLEESGVSSLATLDYSDGSTSATVSIARPGKAYGYEISIFFYKSCGTKRREVTLNIGTFGSFGATQTPEKNYYIVAGALAANLSKVQEKFDALDFGPYNAARRALSDAQVELRSFDRHISETAKAKLVNDILSKLVVGAKIQVGTSYGDKPVYDSIERVTNKLIFLKERNRFGTQTKKSSAIDWIIAGHWKFAD